MGFNNGYDSGYEDARAELEPKIKALEKKVKELEATSPEPSGSGAPGPLGPLCFSLLRMNGSTGKFEQATQIVDIGSRCFALEGEGVSQFDPAKGDTLTASYNGTTIDLLDEQLTLFSVTTNQAEAPGKIFFGTGSVEFAEFLENSLGYTVVGASNADSADAIEITLTVGGRSTTASVAFVMA